MHILYIGHHNLRNDVITRILAADNQNEVNLISPEKIFEEDGVHEEPKYDVSILDLEDTYNGHTGLIKHIKDNKVSGKLIALHNNILDEEVEEFIEAGADRCLSIDCTTNDLVDAITDLAEEKVK